MERDPLLNGNPEPEDDAGEEFDQAETGEHDDDESSELLDVTTLQEELENERKRSSEYLEQAQRARAELVNYRRRTEEELARMQRQAGERIISRLLPAFDDLNRAVESLDEEQSNSSWAEGIQLIQKKLWSSLEAEGVKPIEAVGQPFDPSLHEAISMQEGSNGSPIVIQEFQRGYMLGDRVIRPSMVVVGSSDLMENIEPFAEELDDELDNEERTESDDQRDDKI